MLKKKVKIGQTQQRCKRETLLPSVKIWAKSVTQWNDLFNLNWGNNEIWKGLENLPQKFASLFDLVLLFSPYWLMQSEKEKPNPE